MVQQYFPFSIPWPEGQRCQHIKFHLHVQQKGFNLKFYIKILEWSAFSQSVKTLQFKLHILYFLVTHFTYFKRHFNV
jgi:hypothetical protein